MSNEKWKQNIETALSFEYRTFQVMLWQ
jgi:hypothetical protein